MPPIHQMNAPQIRDWYCAESLLHLPAAADHLAPNMCWFVMGPWPGVEQSCSRDLSVGQITHLKRNLLPQPIVNCLVRRLLFLSFKPLQVPRIGQRSRLS